MTDKLTKTEVRTSKRISHALRHDPASYGLELDEHGFTPLDQVLDACGCTHEVFQRIVACSDKPRFEVVDGLVRATHGHTVDVRAVGEPARPPELLYHGTTEAATESIAEHGLLPMSRQYVHLHENRGVAEEAAGRFRGKGGVVMLLVDAEAAHADGVAFYPAQGGVWLAGAIAPAYLRREDERPL